MNPMISRVATIYKPSLPSFFGTRLDILEKRSEKENTFLLQNFPPLFEEICRAVDSEKNLLSVFSSLVVDATSENSRELSRRVFEIIVDQKWLISHGYRAHAAVQKSRHGKVSELQSPQNDR
jgi:hypothetical protein